MNTTRTFAIVTAVLALAIGTPLLVVAAQRTEPELIGERWYRGDGLGYNVTLTLADDGTYDARWSGCLGIYGRSKGMWVDQGFEIALAPEFEEGSMIGHLRSLRRLKIQNTEVLVPPEDIERVLKADATMKSRGWIPFEAFRRDSELSF